MPRDRFGTDKDVEELARRARRSGWTVSVDGGTHLRWQSPGGGEFRCALTGGPSTVRRVRRNLARLDPDAFVAPPPLPPNEGARPPLVADLRAELGAAAEELEELARSLLEVASADDPEAAADRVRHSRDVLRGIEDALRERARRLRHDAT